MSPLEQDDLGELPEEEKAIKHYTKLKKIYNYQKVSLQTLSTVL